MDDLNKKMMGSPDLNQERLRKLKELFPDLFTIEGKVNLDELKKIADPELVKESERFEFRWFGKSVAKRNAFTPSKATLMYDEQKSVAPERADGNMIIEGENLETLKVLLSAYRGQVKCIYIDPPYNTGKDFVYSDKWDERKQDYLQHIGVVNGDGIKLESNPEASGRFHSNWLNMMYPRLLLARQLLREDGVIFISIDDNEVHHLRKMCDEVFGEENFVTILKWKRKKQPSFLQNHVSTIVEYIMVYGKEKNKLQKLSIEKIKGDDKPIFNSSNSVSERVIPAGIKAKCSDTYIPKQEMKIKTVSIQYLDDVYIEGDRTVNSFSLRARFRDKQEGINNYASQDLMFITANKSIRRDIADDELDKDKAITDLLLDWGQNQDSERELRDLLGDSSVFDNPKPVRLLHNLVKACTDKNDLVVDFFAGSGTAMHAVMALNKEDGGNRKCILVQVPEATDPESEAHKAGYKKISDITIERNKRAIQKIEEETSQQTSLTQDEPKPFEAGFKVYRLAKSNFSRVNFAPDPTKTEKDNLALLDEYISAKEAALTSEIDTRSIFDEVLLKNGFMLNYQKEKEPGFSKNNVYRIRDGHKECLICMDIKIHDEMWKKELQKHKDTFFICLGGALQDTTAKWNLRHLLGEKLIAI